MPRNRSCGSYGPGHLMHWIQAKKSHEDGQPIHKVRIVAVPASPPETWLLSNWCAPRRSISAGRNDGSRVSPNMSREGALPETCDDSKYIERQHIWETANCRIGVVVAHQDGGSGRFESPRCAFGPAASAQNRRRMRANTQVTDLPDRRIRCGDKSVGYDTGAIPVSSMTRRESALLVGSMIRANTNWRNASSPTGGLLEPKDLVGAAQCIPQLCGLRGGDRQRIGLRAGGQPKIQLGLPGGQPLGRGRLQCGHPGRR
jgi:hypothetical protein